MTDNDVRRIEDKVDGVTVALARLEGSLSPSLQKLTEGQDDAEKRADDHEKRLRALERFRFAFPSIAVLALVIDLAAAAYYISHLG